MQFNAMREPLVIFALGAAFSGVIILPEAAFARESEQSETANHSNPRHRHNVARPVTEPAPIRKTEKLRVRRVLM